jgi:hypothetical protein
MRRLFLFGWLLISTIAFAQNRKAGEVADFVSVDATVVNIEDIENVETVFKAGVGYGSKKLIDSARGQVGIR